MCLNCGNYPKISKRRPKNWIDVGYKIIKPFDFKWRHKLGKVECDCMEVIEEYRPWYGITWYHAEGCAMMKHLNRYPGIANLVEVSNVIAQTD